MWARSRSGQPSNLIAGTGGLTTRAGGAARACRLRGPHTDLYSLARSCRLYKRGRNTRLVSNITRRQGPTGGLRDRAAADFLCEAESADYRSALLEACRLPKSKDGSLMQAAARSNDRRLIWE